MSHDTKASSASCCHFHYDSFKANSFLFNKITFIFSREHISGTTFITKTATSTQASHVGRILETMLDISFRRPVRPFEIQEDDGHFFLFGSRLSPSDHLPGHVLAVSVRPSLSSFRLARQWRPWVRQSRPFFDCDPWREGGQFPQCYESKLFTLGLTLTSRTTPERNGYEEE